MAELCSNIADAKSALPISPSVRSEACSQESRSLLQVRVNGWEHCPKSGGLHGGMMRLLVSIMTGQPIRTTLKNTLTRMELLRLIVPCVEEAFKDVTYHTIRSQ